MKNNNINSAGRSGEGRRALRTGHAVVKSVACIGTILFLLLTIRSWVLAGNTSKSRSSNNTSSNIVFSDGA